MSKVALITGASRGIGRAIALEFAMQGAQVVINYAGNLEKAEETAHLVQAAGGESYLVQADVSRPEECTKLVQTAIEKFGKLDIFVHNAGITRDNLLLRMKDKDWQEVLDTNLSSAFYLAKEVARPMMKARSGRIISIVSVAGISGNAGQINYAASKAGLIGFTKSLARELAPRNITVNAVAPGLIETDMTHVLGQATLEKLSASIPLGRAGKPEDVAGVVAFLASEAAAYMTGQVLHVDGGMVM